MSFGASVEYKDTVETMDFEYLSEAVAWVEKGFRNHALRVMIEAR